MREVKRTEPRKRPRQQGCCFHWCYGIFSFFNRYFCSCGCPACLSTVSVSLSSDSSPSVSPLKTPANRTCRCAARSSVGPGWCVVCVRRGSAVAQDTSHGAYVAGRPLHERGQRRCVARAHYQCNADAEIDDPLLAPDGRVLQCAHQGPAVRQPNGNVNSAHAARPGRESAARSTEASTRALASSRAAGGRAAQRPPRPRRRCRSRVARRRAAAYSS